MKRVSIIIPHHSETPEQIYPLLISIDTQIGIDFNDIEILFCCDLETSALDNCDFSEYKNISNKIIKLKSSYLQNPGMSRQAAIDKASGEYIFFCDADDSLYHSLVLRELIDNINNSHADVYRFKFLEEVGSFENDYLQYITKDFNWVWVFAKAYRKDWLKANNIEFNKTIRWHEDTYFNFLCQYCNPKIVDVDDIIYLWKFSRTSVTRVNNHEYTFNTIDEYLDSIGKAFDKISTEYNKNCSLDILKVLSTYHKMLMHPANQNQAKYEEIERCYYEFTKRFANNLFEEIPLDIQRYLAQLRWSGDGEFLPRLSFESYLKYLNEKYSKNS